MKSAALIFFLKWANWKSPGDLYECRCCGSSWTKSQPEEHLADCPVTKFKDEEDIRKLFYEE